jgi:hypothetical protein
LIDAKPDSGSVWWRRNERGIGLEVPSNMPYEGVAGLLFENIRDRYRFAMVLGFGMSEWLRIESAPSEKSLRMIMAFCRGDRDMIRTGEIIQNSWVPSYFGAASTKVRIAPDTVNQTLKAMARHIIVGGQKQCDIRITMN